MTVLVDHLVVAAATLAQGVAWCEATLGVTPGPGGQHPLMGTHNRLLRTSTDPYPDTFLEIIAIDPAAPPPGRARWFGLDNADLQARLQVAPQLVNLVARSTMLDMHRWGLISVGLKPGDPLSASRDTPQGLLTWQIMVREDGTLACGGALPTLIQWSGRHPAQAMPASGITLQSLALRGVPDRARALLQMRGVDVQAGAGPAVSATLHTAQGVVALEST